MNQSLFVYGTLAPGETNHHWLAPLAGTWEPATTTGKVLVQKEGVHAGLPCFSPSSTESVKGQIFTSNQLHTLWSALDDFEGPNYSRQLRDVSTAKGEQLQAFIYIGVQFLS